MDEHEMECTICGQAFDMRDLAAVLLHEHVGITDNLDDELDDIPPGERIDDEGYIEPEC